MVRSRKLLRLLSLAVLAAAGSGACAGSREDAVLSRLIDSDGGRSFTPQTDLSLQPSWQAKAAGPADLPAWSFYVPSSAAALAPSGDGIDLGPLRESQYLVWTGRLSSGTVDVLRFRFEDPLAGLVELYWNGEGEDFGP